MKWIKYIVLLTLTLAAGGCAYYNTLFNAKSSYNQGLKVLRENPDQPQLPQTAQKHFDTTIEKCWKLIDIYTDQSKYADDALLYIAKSEFYIEKYALAKQHLEQFMQKYSESDLLSESRLWYAKVLLKLDEIDNANEYFRLVINNSKDGQLRSQASFELGKFAFEKENYSQAISLLETALKEKIEDEYKALVTFYLAEAFLIQKNYKSAITQYEKVEKYHPTIDVEYKSKLHHSRALSQNGAHQKADKLLRKMMTAPRFSQFITTIKTALAKNYEQQGDLINAEEYYREALKERRNDVGSAEAAFNLAKLYERELHNLDSAVTYYGKVSKLYNKYDSLETANRKNKSLGEYKRIRDQIRYDSRLVERLSNDADFRDSLYSAQREDSVLLAGGYKQPDEGVDTLLTAVDSLSRVVQDSLKDRSTPGDPLQEKPPGQVENDPQNRDAQATQSPEDFQGFRKSWGQDNGKDNLQKTNSDKPNEKKEVLEKRKLPSIEFDLMNRRFELAEYYLLKEENFDSAAYHYHDFLENYEDSLLTPKAYYSLIYIIRQQKNQPQRLYELEKQLLADYIDSPFAIDVMKTMGIYEAPVPEVKQEDKAFKAFLKAESLYFDGKYRDALGKYQNIANLDSTWEISAKAQFAVAWIYEKNLGMTDSAMTAYQDVVNRFPSAQSYVKVARKKISPPAAEKVPLDTSATGPVDSVLPDTTNIAGLPTGKDRPAAPGNISNEDVLKEKIRWRNRRELR